ncbi:MAG: hypothetical protein KDE50_28770 [Caldilineaceae bacterium]|nr:hypothetical protein [Caldilineaceae bacterium]
MKIIRPLLLFVVAWLFYWGTAVWGDNTVSPQMAYFDHLADAFRQGQLYLAHPPSTHDLTQFAGRWYVPFPPLPALLLLPWVALRGLAATNTVLFSTLLGALNVMLVHLLLEALSRRGWSKLGTVDNLWLTLLFGLGCVHWYMATLGSVWFVAQISTVTFVVLSVWLAVRFESAWPTSSALAIALLARPNVVFTWPLLLGIYWMHNLPPNSGGFASWPQPAIARKLAGWTLRSAIPLAIAVALLLGYNVARFDHWLDFGYLTENVAQKLKSDLDHYGQFNLHYASKNLWAMWLALPLWDANTRSLTPDPEGMSLFITTPALIYLLGARRPTPLALGAWVSFVLLAIPLVLYYNTGWWQFGYRFSLDFMVPVMVLLAIGAGRRVSWLMQGLIIVGVAVNAWGITWWY